MLGEQLFDIGGCYVADRLFADVRLDLVFGSAFVAVIGRALDFRVFVHPQPILHALFEWFPRLIRVCDLLVEVFDILCHLRLQRLFLLRGKTLALRYAELILVTYQTYPTSIAFLPYVAVV